MYADINLELFKELLENNKSWLQFKKKINAARNTMITSFPHSTFYTPFHTCIPHFVFHISAFRILPTPDDRTN